MIKNKNGFTLMELMVVIAIIGILSAVAVPNLISWRQNKNYNSGLQRTISVMHSAKARAVKENVQTVIRFDTGAHSFRAFVDNDLDTAWTAGTDRQIDSYEFPHDIRITNAAFGAALGESFITFDGRGLPNVDPGNEGFVQLTSASGLSNSVNVNMTGRIRLTP